TAIRLTGWLLFVVAPREVQPELFGTGSNHAVPRLLKARRESRHLLGYLTRSRLQLLATALRASISERDRFPFEPGENRVTHLRNFALPVIASLCIFSAGCG